MYATKYPNEYRTVSGTYNVVSEDSMLLCDTSAGAVTINLQSIPTNKWNTDWTLYISDISNNAATNNITINAGSGQTVNGASSVVINTNGASIITVISANAKYLTEGGSTGGGGVSGHIIADEGTNLPQEPILNFVGGGVTAADNSGKTDVTIPGILVEDEGVALPQRAIINFTGTGVLATDDSANNRTNVAIGTTNNRIVAVKASSFTPDVRIPSIPLTTGQSWLIGSTSSVIFTNWRQTVSTLGGFNATTGAWTVPATGFYNIRIRLFIGAYNDGVTGIASNADLEKGDFGIGSFLLGFINPTSNAIAVFQDFATSGTSGDYTSTVNTIRTSVIAIDQTLLRVALTGGEQYFVKVLNKTQLPYLITPNNIVQVRQSLTLTIDETI